MSTVSIPKQYRGIDKLIAIPESIYEKFLTTRKPFKPAQTFTPTKSEKLLIERGRREFKQGKFVSVNEI